MNYNENHQASMGSGLNHQQYNTLFVDNEYQETLSSDENDSGSEQDDGIGQVRYEVSVLRLKNHFLSVILCDKATILCALTELTCDVATFLGASKHVLSSHFLSVKILVIKPPFCVHVLSTV